MVSHQKAKILGARDSALLPRDRPPRTGVENATNRICASPDPIPDRTEHVPSPSWGSSPSCSLAPRSCRIHVPQLYSAEQQIIRVTRLSGYSDFSTSSAQPCVRHHCNLYPKNRLREFSRCPQSCDETSAAALWRHSICRVPGIERINDMAAAGLPDVMPEKPLREMPAVRPNTCGDRLAHVTKHGSLHPITIYPCGSTRAVHSRAASAY